MNISASSLQKNWQRRIGGLLGLALPAVIVLALVSCLGASKNSVAAPKGFEQKEGAAKVAVLRKVIQVK